MRYDNRKECRDKEEWIRPGTTKKRGKISWRDKERQDSNRYRGIEIICMDEHRVISWMGREI